MCFPGRSQTKSSLVGRMKERLGKMSKSREYLKYTAYVNLLQLKRLNIIIEEVCAYAKQKQLNHLRILEIGCGIGAIAYPLSSLGHRVVGIDIDAESISQCNIKNPFPSATYIVGDAESLNLQEKFDVVIATEVLEHCPHPENVAQSIEKHITPGGIGIVSVPNGYCLSELVFSRLFQKIGIHSLFHKLPKRVYTFLTGSPIPYYSANVTCHHVQFFTFSRFTRLLKASGFKILHVNNLDLGLLLDWTWLGPLKRMECKLAESAPHLIAGGWVFAINKKDNVTK